MFRILINIVISFFRSLNLRLSRFSDFQSRKGFFFLGECTLIQFPFAKRKLANIATLGQIHIVFFSTRAVLAQEARRVCVCVSAMGIIEP